MIRKGICTRRQFNPRTSGPFPLHPLTCSWPINEVTFGMNCGVSLHSIGHHDTWVSIYNFFTHPCTHTPFLKDTSTCGGILAEFISPPLSLCLLGGYSTSRSCVWLTVGFTVCLPSSRKRRENATFSPTYVPVTHFLKNTSLSWSLLWGNGRRTCWCHLCPSAFTNECAMLYYSPILDSQVCMCVCDRLYACMRCHSQLYSLAREHVASQFTGRR